ncbi:MAG: sodium/solute symporter [Pseudotabrizicola sp.]|uniref:sodium:solute symporter family transporter n=1 Tax=Pseudotabrizicola sp. TaxID=2939647 RepID=UPI0027174B3C|nr:sodium/solute symporter [Pseudotabrizicola sp.]MDO9637022.1 sodium/solute symporter [Pseudotabrizicola sp.]
MPDFEIGAIDLTVAGIYIVAVIGLGLWISRAQKDSEGFLLGGRSAMWPIVGLSLMSANLSGTSYVGLAGSGYSDGIAVWNYEWMGTLVLVFFAIFILPFYLRSKVNTMPQFLEHRYDSKARSLFGGFSVFTAIFIDSAGALFAGAMTLQLLFPEFSLWMLISGIALLGGLYVIFGGLKAVMVTDTVQGILLLIVGTVIFVMVFIEIGGTWQAVNDAAPEGGMSVIKPADDDFMPWPGIFTGVLWLGFYYWTTNHVVVQKVLAAKSLDHGRWGALMAGALQVPFLFILVLPGLMGRALFPDLEESDHIWPALVFEFLPTGLRGLALAALIAALMSTMDSVLNGSASIAVNDFVKRRYKDLSEARLLLISRVLVGVFMIIAALWAPMIQNFDGIVAYFQSFLGYITMPVVVVFLGGLFWARPPRHAAFPTLAIGIPVGLASFALIEVMEVIDLQFLYGTGLMLLLSLGIFLFITFTSDPPELEEDMVFSRKTWDDESREMAEKPWYQNTRYLGLAVVLATLATIAFFV